MRGTRICLAAVSYLILALHLVEKETCGLSRVITRSYRASVNSY